MKAKLEFNLPEEKEDHAHAINAVTYYTCLVSIDQRMRSLLKHGNDYKTAEALAEDIRGMINDRVDLYG